MTRQNLGETTPFELKGNASVSFYIEADGFVAGMKALGKANRKARARVLLGNRDVDLSKWEKAELPPEPSTR